MFDSCPWYYKSIKRRKMSKKGKAFVVRVIFPNGKEKHTGTFASSEDEAVNKIYNINHERQPDRSQYVAR